MCWGYIYISQSCLYCACPCYSQVRWADLEAEKEEQKKREIGFVIGSGWSQVSEEEATRLLRGDSNKFTQWQMIGRIILINTDSSLVVYHNIHLLSSVCTCIICLHVFVHECWAVNRNHCYCWSVIILSTIIINFSRNHIIELFQLFFHGIH